MKKLTSAGALCLSATLMACDIDVKDPGRAPEIEVKDGRMPDIDVRTPDVNVDMKEKQIQVPTDVDVKTETKTIEVPDVDVDIPEENENEPN
jgi:hypothetical protein